MIRSFTTKYRAVKPDSDIIIVLLLITTICVVALTV